MSFWMMCVRERMKTVIGPQISCDDDDDEEESEERNEDKEVESETSLICLYL